MTETPKEIELLKKALARERMAKQKLENKSRELFYAKSKIDQQYKELEGALEKLKEQQAMLVQSENMASIGQLSAGIAHEINNPIGFIRSNIEYLKEMTPIILKTFELYEDLIKNRESDDFSIKLKELEEFKKTNQINYIHKDFIELLNETHDGANRVREIVTGLKDFSDMDEGDKLKKANINELIDSTIKIVNNEVKYKASIINKYNELPLVQCYPSQLNQVFMNLIVNASQAIKDHGLIKIKTRYENNYIIIIIEDNGSGISVENQKRLFTPFFTTKEVGSGTGLGLSISYGIIKNKHKGNIQVASEEGIGTIFRIYIPDNLNE